MKKFRLRVVFAMLVPLTLVLSVGASAAARGSGGPVYEDGVILVGYVPGTSAAAEAAIETAIGAVKKEKIGKGTHVLKVPAGSVEALVAVLKGKLAVGYAEPNYILHAEETANDTHFNLLWGLRNTGQNVNGTVGKAGADISATGAWEITKGSSNVVVGVIDTGVDYNHPDLAANVWSNPGGVGGCPAGTHGFNAITRTCNPLDDHYHGTHVSGTIGAVGNNGTGVTGVSWNTSIMGLKFLNSQGSGTTADAIVAIDFAVQAKQAGVNIRVLNNSWGGGGFSQALLDAINRAAANDILFVAAAGNSGLNNGTIPHYPSSYGAANEIAVAASDQNDNKASFSNYGVTSVDLAAPGTNIFSTMAAARGGGYAYLNGTSMATPHVSGAAALILSTCSLATAALKSAILSNVDPLASFTSITRTGGRLNAFKAVQSCAAPPPPDAIAPVAPTGVTATVGDASVTLRWTANTESDFAGYKVYRQSTDGSWPSTPIATTTANSYTNGGLTNGTTYTYRVTAYDRSNNESTPSTAVSATPVRAPIVKSYRPAAYTIAAGTVYYGQGDVSRLYNNDGSRAEITSSNSVSEIRPSAVITATERSTLRKLTIDYDGNVSSSSASLSLSVCRRNADNSCTWEVIRTFPTGTTLDRSFTWTTTTPAAYVSATGQILFGVKGTRTSSYSFRTRTDWVRFTIEY